MIKLIIKLYDEKKGYSKIENEERLNIVMDLARRWIFPSTERDESYYRYDGLEWQHVFVYNDIYDDISRKELEQFVKIHGLGLFEGTESIEVGSFDEMKPSEKPVVIMVPVAPDGEQISVSGWAQSIVEDLKALGDNIIEEHFLNNCEVDFDSEADNTVYWKIYEFEHIKKQDLKPILKKHHAVLYEDVMSFHIKNQDECYWNNPETKEIIWDESREKEYAGLNRNQFYKIIIEVRTDRKGYVLKEDGWKDKLVKNLIEENIFYSSLSGGFTNNIYRNRFYYWERLEQGIRLFEEHGAKLKARENQDGSWILTVVKK